MDNYKEDTDVFEITDFTTASEWERFIASLEEVINEWKLGNKTEVIPLQKDDMINGTWKQETEQILFADFKFSITRHHLVLEPKKEDGHEVVSKMPENPIAISTLEEEENSLPEAFEDIINSSNDFPGKAHCLVRWYGVRDFIIVACAVKGECISSESRVKILLSSINIAINNTGCSVPIFLEIDRPQRQLYTGIAEGGGMRLDFDMASLKRIPHHLQFMSGLIDMFQKKIGCSVTASPKIIVAVRITFVLNSWPLHLSPNVEEDEGEPVEFKSLKVGSLQDPISDLIVSTTWPRVDSVMVADSDVYSDLDPMSAPQWHLRVAYADQPRCNLCETIRAYVKLCSRRETMNDLFRNRSDDTATSGSSHASTPTLSKAFERLTEPRVNVPNLTSAVRSATSHLRRRQMENAPLSDALIEDLMEFIFSEKGAPPARPIVEMESKDMTSVGTSTSTTASNDAKDAPNLGTEAKDSEKLLDEVDLINMIEKQIKCAPLFSITHRMAICFCCLNRDSGGIHAVTQLWHEIMVELRTRWEAGLYIPDLSADEFDKAPDLGSSLIHQKLQMINCCIEKKVNRESVVSSSFSKTNEILISGCETDDEDEFFECEQELELDDPQRDLPTPSGRKEPFGNQSLLNHPETRLYVPFTQEAAPLTEDAVEELTKTLCGLGATEEGASKRARMQSASLISDMEAFKAANPQGCLIDFVRWYSPRDFLPEDGGKLSQRMQVPGNLWVEAWNEALSVPAKHQKRLFNDTAEAEKVFRYLDSLSPADISHALLPNVLAEAVLELYRYCRNSLIRPPQIITVLDKLRERTGRATRRPNERTNGGRVAEYDDVIRRLGHAEILLSRSYSLESKFLRDEYLEEDLKTLGPTLIQCLSEVPDVALVGAARGPVGLALQRIMVECQKNDYEEVPSKIEDLTPKFAEPAGKEYILRCQYPIPSPYSRPGPQKLYCAVQQDDYRICGAFSKDTMFF